MTRPLSDSTYRLARETDRDIRRLRRKFWWQRNHGAAANAGLWFLVVVLLAWACWAFMEALVRL